MKKIISFFVISLSLLNLTASANEYFQVDSEDYSSNYAIDCYAYKTEKAYSYVSVGVGPILILPTLGVGHRHHFIHHGFDFSLNATTAIKAHQVQASAVYHFIPNPYRQDPWYVGLGIASSAYYLNSGRPSYSLAPDVVIGKELSSHNNRNHFVELHVQSPTWFSKSVNMHSMTRLDIPLTYVKYGIGF